MHTPLTTLLCAFLAGYALHTTLRERRSCVRRVECPYRIPTIWSMGGQKNR